MTLMDSYKTQLDSKQDLTLYIESLFQREEDEPQVETVTETKVPVVISENEVVENKTEQVVSESLAIPEWGQTPFQCLVLKATGMKFIVPALSVSYIEEVSKNIIRIPLETDAFRGVVTLRGKSVAVIDLFTLVAEGTPDSNTTQEDVTSHHIEHVMVMEKGNYALACDEVSEMITLNTEDVRWNETMSETRPYAGVVKDYLCPLINIDNVYQQVSTMSFVQSLNRNNH